jgi:hypothetical protein
MKKSTINFSCPISNTRLYTSEKNNDLIYVKPYKGDWGDWDEQPVCTINETENLDLATSSEEDDITINSNFC